MHTEEPTGVGSAVVRAVLEFADEVEEKADSANERVIATWLRREGHLAVVRAYDYLQNGVPEESAWFLAVDEVGFQLAAAMLDPSKDPE
jgi:hypothetical protein